MEPAHFSEIENVELTDKNTPTSSRDLIVAASSSVECRSATSECLPAVKNCPTETDERRTVTDVCQKAASKCETAIECYRAANECQAAANAIFTNQNTDEMNAINWVKDTDPIDNPSSSCKPTQVKYSLSEMSPSSSLHHPSPRDSGVDVNSPSHRSDEEITASSVGHSTPCTVKVDAVLAPKLASEQFKEANASNTKLHMSDNSSQGLKTIRRARCLKRTSCCDCCHVPSTNQNVKRKRNSFTAIAPAIDKLSMERCSGTQQHHVTHDTGTLKTILKRSATLPSSKKPPRKSTHFNKELKYSSGRSGSNLMRCKNDVAVTTQTEIIAETLRSDFLSINNCNRYVKSSENDALDLDLQCKVQAEKSNDVDSQIIRPELSCESVRPTFRFFSGDRRRSNDSDVVKQNMLRKFAGCGGSPEKKCQNRIGESGVCRKSNALPSLNSVSTKPTKKEYNLTSVIEPNPTKLVIRISTAAKPSSIDRVSSESVVLEKISLPIANKRKSPNICVLNTKVTNVRDPHFASSSQKNSVLFNSNLRSNAGVADQLSRIISFDRFQEPVSKDCSSSLVPKRTSKTERRRISKKSSLKPRQQLINSNLSSRPKDEDPSNIRAEQTDTKLKEICPAAENSFLLNADYVVVKNGMRTDIMNNRKPIFSCLPAEHGIPRQSKVNDLSAEIDICTDVLTQALSKGIVEPPIITKVPVDQSKQEIEATVEKISLSIKRVGSNGTWYVPSKHNESKRKKSKKKKHHTSSSPPLVDVVPEVIRNAFSPAFSLPVVSQPDTPATSPVKKSPTLSQIMCISKIKASIAEFKSKIRITPKKCNDDGSSKSDQSPQKTVAATESIVDSTGENETIPGATTDLDSGIITASSIESNDCLINEEKLCDKDNPSVTNDTTSGIEVIVKTEIEPFVEISRTNIMLSECKKEKELICIVKNDDKKDLSLGNETRDWFSDPGEVVKTVVSSPSVLASPSKMKNYSRTQGFCLSEDKYKVGINDALLLQSMVSLPVDSRYVKQEIIDDDQYDNVLHRPQTDSVSHRPPIDCVPHGPPIGSMFHGLQIDSSSQKPQIDSVPDRPQIDSVLLELPIHSVSHGPLIDIGPSIVGVHGPSNDGIQHELQNDTVCQAPRIEENCNSVASRGLLCVKKEISGFSTSKINILPKSNETLWNEFPSCSATSDPIVPLSRIGKLKKPNMDQLRLSFTTSDFDQSKLTSSDLDVSKLLRHTFSEDLHLDIRENNCRSELVSTEDSDLVTSEKNGINSLNSATEICCIFDPNRATDIGAKTKTASTAKSVSSNPFVCFDQSFHEDVINYSDTITKQKPMPISSNEIKPILVQNENKPKLLLVQTNKIKSLINNVGAVKTSLQTLEHGFESLLLPADQLNPLVMHVDEPPVILQENEPTPLEAQEIKQQTSLRESAKGVPSHAHSVAENNLPISIVLSEETKLSTKRELFSIRTPFKDSAYSELQKVERDAMEIQSDGHALPVRLTEKLTPSVNVTDGQSFSSMQSGLESALKMHASECALSRRKDNEFESCVGQETSATSAVVMNDKTISAVRSPIESIPSALQSSNVLPGNVGAQATGMQSNEPALSARKLTEVSHLISQSEAIDQPEVQGNNAVLSIRPKVESVQPLELRSVLPTGDLAHADIKCNAEPYERSNLLQSANVENTSELAKLITDVKTTELINLLPNVNTAKLTSSLADANVRMNSDGLSIDTSDVSSSVESIFPLLKEAICKALEEFDAPFEPLLIEPESSCITESLTEASFLESASLNFPSLPEETLALHDSCAELDLSLLNDAFGSSHCSSESLLFSETDAVNSISTLSESLAVSEPSFLHTSLHTSLPQKSSSISDLNLLTDSLSSPESSLFLPSNCSQPGVTNTSSPQLGNFPDSLPLNESGVSTELISQAETWPFLDSSLPLESLALLEYFSLNPNCLSSFPEPSAFPEQSLVDALSLLESGCPVSDAVALSEFGPISECMSLAESWSLLESCLSQESLSLPELLSMNDSLSYPHFISPSFKLQSGGSLFSHISKPLTRSMSAPVPLCSLKNESLPLKPTSSTSVFSNSSVKLLFSQPSRSSASVLTNPLCKLLPTQSASSTSVFPNSTSKLLPPMSSFSTSMLPNSTCASEGAITRSHEKAKLDLRVDIPFVSDINKRTRSKTLNTPNSNDSSDQNLSSRLRRKKTGSSCEQVKRTCKNPPLSNPQLSSSVQPVTELETTAPVLIKVRARKPRKSKKSSTICIPTLTAEITASLHAEENNSCVTENEPKISATLREQSHVESCSTNNGLSVTSDDLCSLSNSPVNEAVILKVCSKKKSEKRKRSENDRGKSNVKKLKMNQNNLSKSGSPTTCKTVLVLESVATITNKSRKRKISDKCPALSNIKQEMFGEDCCATSLIHPTEDVLTKLTEHVKSIEPLKDQITHTSQLVADKNASTGLESLCRENPEPVLKISKRKLKPRTNAHTPLAMNTAYEKPCVTLSSLPASNIGNTVYAIETSKFTALIQNTYLSTSNNHGCVSSVDPIARDSCIVSSIPALPNPSDAVSSKRKPLVISNFWDKASRHISKCRKTALQGNGDKSLASDMKRQKSKHSRSRTLSCSLDNKTTTLNIHREGKPYYHNEDLHRGLPLTNVVDVKQPINIPRSELKDVLSESSFDAKLSICELPRNTKNPSVGLCVQSSIKQEYNDCPTLNREQHTKLEQQQCYPDTTNLPFLESASDLKPFSDYAKKNHSSHTKRRRNSLSDSIKVTISETSPIQRRQKTNGAENITQVSCTLSMQSNRQPSKRIETGTMLSSNDEITNNLTSTINLSNDELNQSDKVIKETNQSIEKKKVKTKRKRFNSIVTVVNAVDDQLSVQKDDLVSYESLEESAKDKNICAVSNCDQIASPSTISSTIVSRCGKAITEKKPTFSGGYLSAFAKFLQRSETLGVVSSTLHASYKDISTTDCSSDALKKKADVSGVACLNDASVDKKDLNNKNVSAFPQEHISFTPTNSLNINESLLASSSSAATARKNFRQQSRIFRRSTLVKRMNKSPPRRDTDETSRESRDNEYPGAVQQISNVLPGQLQNVELSHPCSSTSVSSSQLHVVCEENTIGLNGSNGVVSDKRFIAKESEDMSRIIKRRKSCNRGIMMKAIEAKVAAEPNEPSRDLSNVIKQEVACVDRIDDTPDCDADEIGLPYIRIEIDSNEGSVSIFSSGRDGLQNDRLPIKTVIDEGSRNNSLENTNEIYDDVNHPSITTLEDQAIILAVPAKGLTQHSRCNEKLKISNDEIIISKRASCQTSDLEISRSKSATNKECIEEVNVLESLSGGECGASINVGNNGNDVIYDKRTSRNIVENKKILTGVISQKLTNISRKVNARRQSNEPVLSALFAENIRIRGKRNKFKNQVETSRDKIAFRIRAHSASEGSQSNVKSETCRLNADQLEFSQYMMQRVDRFRKRNIVSNENVNQIFTSHQHKSHVTYVRNDKQINSSASEFVDVSFTSLQLKLATLETNVQILLDALFRDIVGERKCHDLPQITALSNRLLPKAEQTTDFVHTLLTDKSSTKHDYKFKVPTPLQVQCSAKSLYKSIATPHSDKASASACVVLLCNHPGKCLVRLESKITAVLKLALPNITVNVEDLCKDKSVDDLLQLITCANSETTTSSEIMPGQA